MTKNAQVGWDDLLFVLAVADEGSVSAAARALGVNHATVLRRISAFESRHGLRIFDKTSRGYTLSPDRRALIEAMRSAGDELARVDRMIDAERPRLTGGLRITSTDTLTQYVLPPILARASREFETHIEVLSDNAYLDFARMEADITVRPTPRLPPELEGERAGEIRFAIYASDPDVTGWLRLSGKLARTAAAAWLRNRPGEHAMGADSFLTLAALARAGRGRALLPDYVGRAVQGLVCLGSPEAFEPVPIWVASHVDFARSGRLTRARAFLVRELRTWSESSAETGPRSEARPKRR